MSNLSGTDVPGKAPSKPTPVRRRKAKHSYLAMVVSDALAKEMEAAEAVEAAAKPHNVKDVNWRITPGPSKVGYLQQAITKALFGSIFPQEVFTKGNVPQMAMEVVERQRARLHMLREAGWKTLQDKRKYGYLRNCPLPPIVYFDAPVEKDYQPCDYWMACPWCWARRIVQAPYEKIVKVLWPGGYRDFAPREKASLTAYKIRLDKQAQPFYFPKSSALHVCTIPNQGSFAFWNIATRSEVTKVDMKSQGLMLNPERILEGGEYEDDIVIWTKQFSGLTRAAVAEACAWVGKYPQRLLSTQTIAEQALWLNKQGRPRLIATSGCLYGVK